MEDSRLRSDDFSFLHSGYALGFRGAAECVGAFAQGWSCGVLFILPDFYRIGLVLDEAERDDAELAMVLPEWASERLRACLDFGPLRERIVARLFIAAGVLVMSNERAFFCRAFMNRLFTSRAKPAGSRAGDGVQLPPRARAHE